MTAAVLYVAAAPVEPGGVLNTPEPVPPLASGRWKCGRCLMLKDDPAGCSCAYPFSSPADVEWPVSVGRWSESPFVCDGVDMLDATWHELWCEEGTGTIVELVTVSGPSHRADECAGWARVNTETWEPVEREEWRYCHPDAAPDGWHSPVEAVTRLDVPVPCERPDGAVWWAPTKETD